ncbi:MAG: aminoacyl-tRNA hydrolase [Candidatus Eisenbacteria bacterium]|nr:aminoacyl-tRNA hydrolase [Candidatus Eisenbacteria bacterium]
MPIRCVAGLGNPGVRYEWTRHNAGFWVVDRMAVERSTGWRRLGLGLEARCAMEGRDIVLLKPLCFMNRSGEAVLECLERHLLVPGELLVVVDDVSLPAGRLRLRASGSAGGHRGLESVEESLGKGDYPRLRIGVGGAAEDEDLAEYVLRPLEGSEREFFGSIAGRGAEAATAAILEGLETAMNRFNPAGFPIEGDPPGRTGRERSDQL